MENLCTKCGNAIPDIDPEFIVERNERGQMRVFPSLPELCDRCRSDRFWHDMDKRLDR